MGLRSFGGLVGTGFEWEIFHSKLVKEAARRLVSETELFIRCITPR